MRRMEMMRLSAVLALGAILAQTFVFANYTIVHRRTFNLNATFAGAEAIGDVAFDGNNLYVSSWHNNSGVQTVRLVQVGDIGTLLNITRSGALTPAGWTVTVSATGASRDTRLAYYNNHLYWGVGLGATADTGIRRVDLAGNIVGSWAAGAGVLLPSGINPSASRFDTLDIDPNGPALGIGVFGSSNIRRNDLTTGAALAATGAIGNLPTNGGNTRDIAFRPDGGVYVRYNSASGTGASGIYFAPRNADGSFGDASPVVGWSEGALQQAFVAYIPVNEVFFSGFLQPRPLQSARQRSEQGVHLQCRQRHAFGPNRAGRHGTGGRRRQPAWLPEHLPECQLGLVERADVHLRGEWLHRRGF
jgi:hypothetical protein